MPNLEQSDQRMFYTSCIESHGGFKYDYRPATGFFFRFKDGNLVFVTNKHCVEGADRTEITVHLKDDEGNPSAQITKLQLGSYGSSWFPHNDSEVDLCAALLEPAIDESEIDRGRLFINAVNERNIVSEEEATMLPKEGLMIVGYPRGQRDIKHGYPAVRKGSTVVPSYPLDCLREHDFLIDAKVTFGSSGSPVFLEHHALDDGTPRLLGVICRGSENPCTTIEIEEPGYPEEIKLEYGLAVAINPLRILEIELKKKIRAMASYVVTFSFAEEQSSEG